MNAILAEMQKEIWAMEPRALNALFAHVIEVDISAMAGVEVTRTAPKLNIIGDTAVIPIHGVLLKKIPSLFCWLCIEMTSYLDIQNQITEALGNDQVKKIVLDIDSPGGKVAGAMETGQLIAEAAKIKKVTAQIEDLGASGAYWLASQTSKITAGPNAAVGSIGVFAVFVDLSKMAEMEGVQVHVVRSGEHKGMGVPGDKITDSQIEAMQDVIDGVADNFIKAVSSGRKMSVEAVRKLADGRIWLAAEAKKNGLIDSVIKQTKSVTINSKGNNMAEGQETQIVTDDETTVETKETVDIEAVRSQANADEKKRLGELEAAFPDDPSFVVEQFKAGATVEQAKVAYCDVLQKKNVKLEEEKAKLQKDKTNTDGASAIVDSDEGGESDGGFIAVAKQLVEEKSITMTAAMKKVRKDQPGLYEAYIAAQQAQAAA